MATHVGTGAESHVSAVESNEFRDPQARLDGNEEKRAVAPSNPGSGVGSVKESLDFQLDKEFHTDIGSMLMAAIARRLASPAARRAG